MQHVSKIYIKGMVCRRCIHVVKTRLEENEIGVIKVELGEVTVVSSTYGKDVQTIRSILLPLGFELLEDKKIKTVCDVKNMVTQVYSGSYDFPDNFRFSDLISLTLNKPYDKISALFALLEHQTIEQYSIEYRIEKVKELLVYTTFTLADIAFKLNFSSVPHLSRQFKQYTGLTPSHFKNLKKTKNLLGGAAQGHLR